MAGHRRKGPPELWKHRWLTLTVNGQMRTSCGLSADFAVVRFMLLGWSSAPAGVLGPWLGSSSMTSVPLTAWVRATVP
jgi:hypothetical protein